MTALRESYTATVYRAEPDEGGFWAEVTDLPGCVAQGETLDELMANLHDAVEAWEETWAESNPDPRPRAYATVTISLAHDSTAGGP